MGIEAIKGAGMTYQGSSSTAETKVDSHPRLSGNSNGTPVGGIVKENIGTITKPEYVWFGSYYKSKVEDRH